MSDSSAHQDPAQQAKAAMSGAYNKAVSEAGPGLTTTALALAGVVALIARFLQWGNTPTGAQNGLYLAFNPNSTIAIGLLVVGAIVVARMGGNAIPLGTTTTLFVNGIVGLVAGVFAVISAFSALGLNEQWHIFDSSFGAFLALLGGALICLAGGLWSMSETKR